MYTHGTVLAFEEKKLIQHELFDTEETGEIISIITYKFKAQGNKTLLTGTEVPQDDLSPEDYADAVTGWDEALKAVKEIAEKK